MFGMFSICAVGRALFDNNYCGAKNCTLPTDTVNMTEEEMNKFRHIASSAQAMQDLEFIDAIKAIFGKEILDISQDGLEDTLYDLKNDLKALKLHFEHNNLSDDDLYDYVFTKYILPYRK